MEGEQFSLSLPPSHSSCFNFLAAVLHPDRRHGTPFSSGWKIVYILRPLTLRTSEPCHSPLGAPRGAQATSPLRRLLKVRDTSGFLSSELLQVADIVHAGRDVQPFPPTSVFPALAFTASLVHASMHEDAVSSPLLQPDACPSLQGDVQSGDPVLVSPLICLTPLPLLAFLHTWRDLPGVLPWILRMIQFGYTLQFAGRHLCHPHRFDRDLLNAEQRQQGFCPTTGSLFSSTQRGHRGVLLFGSTSRLLQPVFSSPEEVWGFAYYTRSAQIELLPLQRKIQDADAQEHSFPGPRGGLVRHGQPEGCLLPHPGGSEAQEVPQVRLQGKGLPIQGYSLWTSYTIIGIFKTVNQYGC